MTDAIASRQAALLLRAATLSEYVAAKLVRVTERGIEFTVRRGWPLPGENRLGYSQLVRLIEVTREFHWNGLRREPGSRRLDSVVRWIGVCFDAPVVVGRRYRLALKVARVGNTSYDLEVRCEDVSHTTTAFRAMLRAVLIETSGLRPIRIPVGLREQLASQAETKQRYQPRAGLGVPKDGSEAHISRRATPRR